MKNLTRLCLGTAIGSFLVLGTALAGNDGSPSWHQSSLVGTWQFEMTVRFDQPDCTTAPEIPVGPNPFPALVSFHEGGTMNEYASRTAPSIRTTGFGSWEQTGKYNYKARHTFMEFDVNGALWRTMVVESNIRLARNDDAYDAVARLELTDISGNVLNFCATIDAVRFRP